MKTETDFETLRQNYCEAANALTDYRRKHGWEPGVRVIAQYKADPPKTGVIAPYGQAWNGPSHFCVPVILDAGYVQPWDMSDLALAQQGLGRSVDEGKEATSHE